MNVQLKMLSEANYSTIIYVKNMFSKQNAANLQIFLTLLVKKLLNI